MEFQNTKTQIFTLTIFLFFQLFPIVLTSPNLPHGNRPSFPQPQPQQQQTQPQQQPPQQQQQQTLPQQQQQQQQQQQSQPQQQQQPQPQQQQAQPSVSLQQPSQSLETEPQEFLDAHNKARAHAGQTPYVWDETLASHALSWANQRKSDCRMIHSLGPYGENIFWGGRDHWTASDAVKSWVKEHRFYNRKTNACLPNKLCGHYTQIVWRDSTKLGCARVKCFNGGIFIMCNYDPPGNYVNENPFEPLSSPTTS